MQEMEVVAHYRPPVSSPPMPASCRGPFARPSGSAGAGRPSEPTGRPPAGTSASEVRCNGCCIFPSARRALWPAGARHNNSYCPQLSLSNDSTGDRPQAARAGRAPLAPGPLAGAGFQSDITRAGQWRRWLAGAGARATFRPARRR